MEYELSSPVRSMSLNFNRYILVLNSVIVEIWTFNCSKAFEPSLPAKLAKT